MPPEKFDPIERIDYSADYDYRFEVYPPNCYIAHPHDCSVVTFRGHRVLKTLIRCHFSPPESTNSRYVYSGSQDGKVYVYNMDATLAGTIDVGASTANSRPQPVDTYTFDDPMTGDVVWKTCVRDASWHPSAPVLAGKSMRWIYDMVLTVQRHLGTAGACRLVHARCIHGTTTPGMMKAIRLLGGTMIVNWRICLDSAKSGSG